MRPRSKNQTPRTQARMDRLASYLRSHRGRRGIFPKLATMEDELGWSISTVRRMLALLKLAGRLSWIRRGPTSALYSLSVDTPMEHSLEHSSEHSRAPYLLTESLENRRALAMRKPPASTATKPYSVEEDYREADEDERRRAARRGSACA